MRDHGLDEAIRAAGGISELARRIGISQPSVSNWERIPAERVLSIEAATGIARGVLRPDLYAVQASPSWPPSWRARPMRSSWPAWPA
jgi:DNA-binding transcriptional regulator YdaS (Cro superfamily)